MGKSNHQLTKEKIAVLLVTIVFVAFSTRVVAQDETKTRTVGISASLQNNIYGINLPIWLHPKFVLAPSIGINYAQNIGTDYTIGLMPKFYLKTEKLSPFIDFKIAAIFNSPQTTNDTNSKTDLLIGTGFGGEYFFNDNFSVSAEFQGNLTSSDKLSNRFGNPGNINFNLATVVTINVYFTK
jgi:hypothetical protein